jgi:hypothetical protein
MAARKSNRGVSPSQAATGCRWCGEPADGDYCSDLHRALHASRGPKYAPVNLTEKDREGDQVEAALDARLARPSDNWRETPVPQQAQAVKRELIDDGALAVGNLSKRVRQGITVNALYDQLKIVRRLCFDNSYTASQLRKHTQSECATLWEWIDRIPEDGKRDFLKVEEWDDGDKFIFLHILTLYKHAPHLSKKPKGWTTVRDWRKAYLGYRKYGTPDGRKPK